MPRQRYELGQDPANATVIRGAGVDTDVPNTGDRDALFVILDADEKAALGPDETHAPWPTYDDADNTPASGQDWPSREPIPILGDDVILAYCPKGLTTAERQQ